MSGKSHKKHDRVALLAEGVDRNKNEDGKAAFTTVALLAEGVDRNLASVDADPDKDKVALLAEGVDRNWWLSIVPVKFGQSRPPRGGRG